MTGGELVVSKDSQEVTQFGRSDMSDSLQPRGLQHSRLPCPSPTPGARSNSCPIESVMPSSHLILCRPLLLLLSIFPSIRVFSNESVLCIRWLGALGSMKGTGGDLQVKGMLRPGKEEVPQKVRQGKEGMELDWS